MAKGKPRRSRKPRRARGTGGPSLSAGQTRPIGHLLVQFQGQYYFVPSDKIQGPLLDDDPEVMKDLEDEVADLISRAGNQKLIGLDFAMEIAPVQAASGMAKKRT